MNETSRRACMRNVGVGLVLAIAAAGCARGPNVASDQLPLRRVVVYRNGVAYYERGGQVDANEVKFRMRQQMVGDFLATLAIVEAGGSTVRSASFPIKVEEQYQDPRAQEFQSLISADFKAGPKLKNPLRDVTLKLDGEKHDLAVGYVAETPVWRPSYRVVIGKDGKAELQAWGIVENLSGENWSDIQLVLVAGAPLAFQSNLGQPVTPQRPLVSDSGEVIDAMPEGMTSVADSKGAVERYDPEAQAAAPAPPAEPAAADEVSSGPSERKRSGGGAAAGKMKAAASPAIARADRAYSTVAKSEMALAKPMLPQASAPSAPRNVSALAAVAVQSGATRYEIPFNVTVPDESATMVLLLQQTVPGESVFLFAPEPGVADSGTHPFRVARFSNSTKGLLERGPVAVFDKGSFLGQGLLDSLPPGATATVPFALERAVGVQSEFQIDVRNARLARIEAGSLFIERDTVYRTTYKVQNGGEEAVRLLVRHMRHPGTRLFRPPTGTEDNTAIGSALVPIGIKANARQELVVDERAASQNSEDWLSPLADEAVGSFLKDERVERAVRDQLTAVWDIRQQWKKLQDEQSVLTSEREELERNQEEMRSNLQAIRKNEQAADLRAKLTKKLDESLTRFDKVQKRLVELSVLTSEQRVRFQESIRGLKVTSVVPPKD